jgi:DNA mismatch endonuclease (patch repair protein)
MTEQESWASSEGARHTMQANRGRDTGPELAVRRLLHARGLRYRVNARPEKDLRRTADIVFRAARVAIFIDGCFWHGCLEHGTHPKSHATFWEAKITGNRARDAETTQLLKNRGWTVLRFWEHEAPEVVAKSIERVVREDGVSPKPERSRTGSGLDDATPEAHDPPRSDAAAPEAV